MTFVVSRPLKFRHPLRSAPRGVGGGGVGRVPHTILVRTTSRYFKFALTYIFSFPFAIWNSNSSSVEMSKQTNRSDLNAKSTTELQERGELEGFQIRKCLIVVEIPASGGSE